MRLIMDVNTLASENYTQVRHKEYETSALLLNNPIVIKSGRVIPHPVNQIQNKAIKLNSQKQPAITSLSEMQRFLPLQTIQKMIERFLAEKQMPIKQLAEKLGISPFKLTRLNAVNYEALAAEINLPLIKLYCKTKWI